MDKLMSTLYPNPLASPASQPQPNVMNQYSEVGMPMMTEPRNAGPVVRGIRPPTGARPPVATPDAIMAAQSNQNSLMPGTDSAGITGLATSMGAPVAATTPSMQAQNAAAVFGNTTAPPIRPPGSGRSFSGIAPNAATFAGQNQPVTPMGGTNAGAVRVGGIRPPRAIRPTLT
jgi:hypothetical protein